MAEQVQAPFRKSVRCDTGSCVEVSMGDEIVVRNSTDKDKTAVFSKDDWRDFVKATRDGQFDIS